MQSYIVVVSGAIQYTLMVLLEAFMEEEDHGMDHFHSLKLVKEIRKHHIGALKFLFSTNDPTNLTLHDHCNKFRESHNKNVFFILL